MPVETEFQKILKITRYAVRDAKVMGEYTPLNSVFETATAERSVLVCCSLWLSRKLVRLWFNGRRREIVMNWYDTVYSLRSGRDVK